MMETMMDASEVNALLDEVAKRIGRAARCPCCAGSDWTPVDRPLFLWAIGEKGHTQALRSVGWTCVKCSFLRLHAVAPEA
jgi:hypothetical protein